MSRLRLAQPATPPVLRPLDSFHCHLHSADLRARWEAAVAFLRSRPGGSLWLLDNRVGRK